LSIEGRPKTQQQEPKLFVGLASGQSTTNPQYLLSFTVDASASGQPKELLPLSGLTTGDTYTAYLKGQATLSTASTFTVKPNTADLGTVQLLVGDLNDDNVIDQQDKDLFMKSYGARSGSEKWNPIYDFNLDGVLNAADLAFITKNMNKTGSSGQWGSKLPASATASASPVATSAGSLLEEELQASPTSSPQGGPREIPGQKGYWMWVPSI
jgi:hypothetical protein